MHGGVYTLWHPNAVHRCVSPGHIPPTVASGGGALRAYHSHRGQCRVVGAIIPVFVVVLVVPLMGMAGMLTLWAMWHSCLAPMLVRVWLWQWSLFGGLSGSTVLTCILFQVVDLQVENP